MPIGCLMCAFERQPEFGYLDVARFSENRGAKRRQTGGCSRKNNQAENTCVQYTVNDLDGMAACSNRQGIETTS
jgi:hypothetical protein